MDKKEVQNKIKEYKLTDTAVRLASFIVLDGLVCKDRWNFETGPDVFFKTPRDVTNTNIIIGYNGHLMFTSGQNIAKITENNIIHKTK